MDPIKPSRCHALQFIACPQLILPVDVDARADLAWPPPLGISRGRGGVRWLDHLAWRFSFSSCCRACDGRRAISLGSC